MWKTFRSETPPTNYLIRSTGREHSPLYLSTQYWSLYDHGHATLQLQYDCFMIMSGILGLAARRRPLLTQLSNPCTISDHFLRVSIEWRLLHHLNALLSTAPIAHARQRFASEGVFAATIWPSTSTIGISVAICGPGKNVLDRRKSLPMLHMPSKKYIHNNGWRKFKVAGRRETSSASSGRAMKGGINATSQPRQSSQASEGPVAGIDAAVPLTANKHLRDRLPDIRQIHRPSKEELLAAATGFWSRLKVRFKWFSIRSVRPFNADEIGAFFSWVLLGHVLWIILGTTTFFSLAIFAVNTVFAQGRIFTSPTAD